MSPTLRGFQDRSHLRAIIVRLGDRRMPAQVSMSSETLFRDRTEQLRRTLRKAKRGSPAGVHKTRVATRRLRELLPLLGLEHDRAKRLLRRLAKAAERLGRIRDLDVQLSQIDRLIRAEGPASELSRFRAELHGKAERRRKRLLAGRTVASLERVVERLDRSAEQVTATRSRGARDLRWAVQARMVRRAADLRRALNSAGSLYEPERLHRVRVTVKKLRYTMEIAAGVFEGRFADDLRLLAAVQQTLGRQHDAQVLLDTVRALDAAAPAGTGASQVAQLEATLDGRCHRLHGRFLRSRQGLLDLCARLGSSGASAGARQQRKAG